MDVKFVWEHNRKRKQVFQLRGDEMVIGRQSGSGLRIPSPEVSRVHCRICREDGYITVEDCDSANGTLVNGTPISDRRVLYPGDRLQVGPITLVVEYQMTQATLERLRAEEEEVLEGLPLEDSEEQPAAEIDDEEPVTVEETPGEEEEIQGVPLEDEDEVAPVQPVELDEAEPWHLPEPDELRDILSQLEDPEA
jgi:pSer/pThr/pTyr-binding forkhead associated (FHA) protein